jgi:hypothetical protein
MLTLIPANFVPAGAAGLELAAASDAAGVDAGGADVGALAAGGVGLAAGLHAARTRTKPTAGAIDLNRDTGLPPLDPARCVQHTERPAVG